jgi:hypothetical protein
LQSWRTKHDCKGFGGSDGFSTYLRGGQTVPFSCKKYFRSL